MKALLPIWFRLPPASGLLLAASLLASGCRSLWDRQGPVSDELLTCRQLSIRAAGAMERGDVATAEKLLALAVECCPVDPESRRVYAETLWKKNDRSGAIAQLNQAIRLSSEDPALYARRGEMHLEMGHLQEALLDAAASLDLDPKSQRAWLLRARVMRASGGYAQALADYYRALDLAPTDRTVLLELADLHRQLAEAPAPDAAGHARRCLAMLQMLADTYPRGQEPRDVLKRTGLAQQAVGRARDAAETLLAAARAGPPDPEIYFLLAQARLAAGDASGAQLALNQAQQLAPDNAAHAPLHVEIQAQLAAQPEADVRWR